MGNSFPGIPSVPTGAGREHTQFLSRLKENVEMLTNARGRRPYQLPIYATAELPAAAPGQMIFVSDGRKAGEAAGKGSGVMCFSDLTKWCACDTGLAVTK